MDYVNTGNAQIVETYSYFPTIVSKTSAPQYVEIVKKVALELTPVAEKDREDDSQLCYMSPNIFGDERISEFCENVIQFAWNVLDGQGYNLSKSQTYYQAMWMQEHYKSSGMEKHVHSYGTQIVGFYFLEVPENSSRLVLHDPRPAKIQIDAGEKHAEDITPASQMINFIPQVGDLYLTNAWLPHSFTRHGNDAPCRFIHINIGLQDIPHTCSLPTVI